MKSTIRKNLRDCGAQHSWTRSHGEASSHIGVLNPRTAGRMRETTRLKPGGVAPQFLKDLDRLLVKRVDLKRHVLCLSLLNRHARHVVE